MPVPVSDPDMAASSVETWNSRSASSTSLSEANAANRILAIDSDTRTIASSCLSYTSNAHIRYMLLLYQLRWSTKLKFSLVVRDVLPDITLFRGANSKSVLIFFVEPKVLMQ